MSSETAISQGKKLSSRIYKEQGMVKRNADQLFFNYSRLENPALWESKFRLNILKIFIEYFCIRKRVPFKDLMNSVERMIIVRTLSQFDGNQRKAAEFLGLKHTTLNEKIKRYNIRVQKEFY